MKGEIMHIPEMMKMGSNELIHQFIEEFSFGTLITEQLEANHLPFMLKKSEGDLGTLYGHFSRANRLLVKQDGCNVMVILEGPHSYISPSWYASFPAVPTWNYAAVHLYGEMTLLSTDKTITALDEMVSTYEPELLIKGDIITDEYRDRLAQGIVGFKIKLTKMLGKQKLGQNRKLVDQAGVVKGLELNETSDAKRLLSYMKKRGIGIS